MSDINIGLGGSGNGGYSINVEQMSERLNTLKSRLEEAASRDPKRSERIEDRIEKVNGQLERLNALSGEDLTISPERAQRELAAGMMYVEEGLKYLDAVAPESPEAQRAAGELNNWKSHIARQQHLVDLYG